MKNNFLYFFIFFIISSCLFSYNLEVVVKDSGGYPIKDSSVIVGNFSKTTDQNGKVQFKNIKGEYNIYVHNDNYNPGSIQKTFKADDSITFMLTPIKHNFYVSLYRGESLGHLLDDKKSTRDNIKGAIINVYSKGSLLYSLDYQGGFQGIQIPDGNYDFEVFTLFSPPYIIKDITLKKQEKQYVNIFIPLNLISVEGKVFHEKSLIGGVKLTFQNMEKERFEVYTNINGSFELSLLPNVYDLEIEKPGYTSMGKYQFEFFDTEKKYYPEIELVEIPSTIEGYIYDSRGITLANTKLDIKNNDKSITVYSDLNGFYKAEVERGLVFIRAIKDGYYPSGKIERVEAFSTKQISDIVIQEKLGAIEGKITDGVSPIAGLKIELYDDKNNFIAETLSNSNGFFSFDRIKALKNYYLSIDNPAYVLYKSAELYVDNNESKQSTIILEDNNVNFVVELVSKTINDLENIEVIINETKFSSDLNGIVNDKVLSREKVEEINVSIPEFKINKKFMTKDLGQEPYLIKINLD